MVDRLRGLAKLVSRHFWNVRFLSYWVVAILWTGFAGWLIGSAVSTASLLAIQVVGCLVIGWGADAIWNWLDRRKPTSDVRRDGSDG